LTTRRFENSEFLCSASYTEIVQFGRHHSADQAGERIELVHPCAPESRHGGGGDGDSAEEGEEDYDEGVNQGGDECIGGEGGDCLTECNGKEFVDHDDQVLVSCTVCCEIEASGEVECNEILLSDGEL